MWSRLSIVIGLLAGMATAALVLGGIIAFAPEPAPAVTPAPTVALVSPSPSTSSPTFASSSPPASASASAGSSDAVVPSDSGALPLGLGKPAPTLVVPQVGGGTIDLASLKGQPVWVDFTRTDAPSSQDEFPLMNGFAARYAEDGLVVLVIDVNEDEGTVAAFADQLGATFPLGLDRDGSVADRWGASAQLPAHFWIDRDGILTDAAFGGLGADAMAKGLQTILPDVTVTP